MVSHSVQAVLKTDILLKISAYMLLGLHLWHFFNSSELELITFEL